MNGINNGSISSFKYTICYYIYGYHGLPVYDYFFNVLCKSSYGSQRQRDYKKRYSYDDEYL